MIEITEAAADVISAHMSRQPVNQVLRLEHSPDDGVRIRWSQPTRGDVSIAVGEREYLFVQRSLADLLENALLERGETGRLHLVRRRDRRSDVLNEQGRTSP